MTLLKHLWYSFLISALVMAGTAWAYTTKGYVLMDTDGSGLDVHGHKMVSSSSYSGMWYHNGAATTAIITQNLFTKIDHFENVGDQDIDGNITASTANDKFTLGANAAGDYDVRVQTTLEVAGGTTKEIMVIPGYTFATPITVTNATNATPIVITTGSNHNLLSGDMVRISGVGGNTAANGDFFVVYISPTSFSLKTLAEANVAGNGTFTTNGSITIEFPGNLALHSAVSGSQLERGAAGGRHHFSAGDVIELFGANTEGVEDILFRQINFTIERIY